MTKATHWVALAATFTLLAGGMALAHDTGPHKGPVAEWGDEEYHVEVVPDAQAGAVTAYVYGDHDELAKGKTKAIDAKSLVLTVKGAKTVTVKLDPRPAQGDPAGKSSVFVGKHAVFSQSGKLSGTVSGKVGNKPYTGDFKQK